MNATNQPRIVPADSKGLNRTRILQNEINNLAKNASEVIGRSRKSEKKNVVIERGPKYKEYAWNDYQTTKKFTTKKKNEQGYYKKVMDWKTVANDKDPSPIRNGVKWTERIPYIYYSLNNPKKKREHKSRDTSRFERKETALPIDLKPEPPSVHRVSKTIYKETNVEKHIYRVVIGNQKINLNKIVTDLLNRNENNVIVITKTATVATSRQPVSKTSSEDYIKFADDITADAIKNNMYSDHSMKQVFKKHLEKNRNKLDEDKMILEIEALKKALNIADSHSSIKSNYRKKKLMPPLPKPYERKAASHRHRGKPFKVKYEGKPINLIESAKSFFSKGYGHDTIMKDRLTKNAWLGYKDLKLDETINLLTKQQSVIKALMNIDVTNAIKFKDCSKYRLMDKGDPEKEYDTKIGLQPDEPLSRFFEVPFNYRDDEMIDE